MGRQIGVAIYGANGHQVHNQLVNNLHGRLVAVGEFLRERLPEALRLLPEIRFCADLGEILAMPEVDLVVLCSPRRIEQAAHAIACLEAGKHVYAEKPAAFTEEELERILAAARKGGRIFHEMAGSALEQPWLEMRRLCQSGKIGEVIQVFAQKSYPYHDQRPQDEDVDGGLLMQVGIHAARFIEHVTGLRIGELSAMQTKTGNPAGTDTSGAELRMACAVNMRLENGALATLIANYCNSRKFGSWGNEQLRVFGSKGFIEATNGGRQTHLYLNDEDCGELPLTTPGIDYFDEILKEIAGIARFPLTVEEELSPLRAVIRARAAAIAAEL